MRRSLHQEPSGVAAIARHYVGDLVYGANDGLITTFAVVAGVTGGQLSARAILIIGVANLVGDGLSMGVGNYLSIRSHEGVLAAQNLPEEEARPARHGVATMLAFVAAGAVPLVPFAVPAIAHFGVGLSVALTFLSLFTVGALRSVITVDRWWTAGLEMLWLGLAVAGAAYGSGALVAWLLAAT
jgi:VIT1/CCC1 family predicted Fe2+/Mn2+ transporter